MNNKISPASICVKEYDRNESTKPHQLPIYATSSFEFDSIEDSIEIFTGQKEGHSYSRYGNPTIDTVAKKLAALESYGLEMDAYAYLTSSGMSAISTVVLSCLRAGDKLLTQSNLYGGTTVLFTKMLSQMGIETIFTDLKDVANVEAQMATDAAIKMMYMETPANPTMACIDIGALTTAAKHHEVLTAIDNTFCTPLLQQPLALGVDFVVHSTTKYLNGHGNSISGVIIGHRSEYQDAIHTSIKLLGPTSNAWDAWLINNGLKTLHLRMERHCSNAMQVATYLSDHPKVTHVNYNGLTSHPDHELAKRQMKDFGGMLSFGIRSGMQGAKDFINSLQFCSRAPTLGDVDTLVLHPATTSHLNVDRDQRIASGVTDGLIRISTGIEDVNDIVADIERGLG